MAATLYLINFINGLAKGKNSWQRHGSRPYLWSCCPLIRLVATQPKLSNICLCVLCFKRYSVRYSGDLVFLLANIALQLDHSGFN